MLEVLQQLPSEEKKPMELRTREDKQELRVLGAMATLLVQRFQVTAVTSGGSSRDVSLVACADSARSDTLEHQASSLTDSFFASINPRRPRRNQAPSNSDRGRISVIQNWTTQTPIDVKNPLNFIIANW
jgi:hypothetical protein